MVVRGVFLADFGAGFADRFAETKPYDFARIGSFGYDSYAARKFFAEVENYRGFALDKGVIVFVKPYLKNLFFQQTFGVFYLSFRVYYSFGKTYRILFPSFFGCET